MLKQVQHDAHPTQTKVTFMTTIDTLSVELTADSSAFKSELENCDKLAKGFGKALTGALSASAIQGKGLTEVMGGLAMKLSKLALNQALKPLSQGLASGFGSLFGGGGESEGGLEMPDTPFAHGGVISAPTGFPMANGRNGLMGEAGSEAIMPLTRTADGSLGVAMQGGGGGGNTIIMNVSATDAASFKRSENDLNAMLSRASNRGQRSL